MSDAEVKNSSLSLTPDERETIISWCDSDKSMFYIYSSQQPMIRKLLRNPLFVLKDKRFNKSYRCYPGPISVDGYLPIRSLTIRSKLRTLTPENRKKFASRLREYHKNKKKEVNK